MTNNWTDHSGYTQIELYPNGEYKSFVPINETEWLIGKTHVKLRSETVIKFYEDGYIEFCFLVRPATLLVFGVPVIIAEDKVIEFHNDGNFRAFTVGCQKRGFLWMTKTWVYRGKTYEPGTSLEFSISGEVVNVRS